MFNVQFIFGCFTLTVKYFKKNGLLPQALEYFQDYHEHIRKGLDYYKNKERLLPLQKRGKYIFFFLTTVILLTY